MNKRSRPVVAILLLAALVVAAGCNDNELGKEKRQPNQPPQTILASGPPDSTYGANYKVHLFWSGSDPDGTIDHYDFILIDHPAADDSIAANDPNYPGTVAVAVPEPDDPRWTSTTGSDTLIVTRADTLRIVAAPPRNANENVIRDHNNNVVSQSFERWHSFFVRAVDNEGAVDLTPEYRSFNSQTLAPTVALKPPVNPALEQFSGPRTIVFNWTGSDDTGEGITIDPIASRWVILKTTKNASGYVGYPDTLYRLPPSAWQPWRQWSARDKTGVQAIVRNLLTQEEGGGYYMFAVQGMDEAGAVTPIFDAKTLGRNNVARVFVNNAVGATLIVDEKFLGTYRFVSGAKPVRLDVAAGQPLTFSWRGDAESYGGEIEAYRYGWNIRNPSNDEEWEQGWCATCRSAPVRAFSSGTQRFFLETRDNAESITHAEFELVVQQVTRRRDLLFVDDTVQPQGDAAEATEDRRWRDTIDSLVARGSRGGQPFTFDFSRDWYDVVNEHQSLPPPLSTVFDYKTVVWTVVQGAGGSAINRLANFFDPFVDRNKNAVVAFNYLTVYIDNGGEFWLSGFIPAYTIFDVMNVGPADLKEKLPVNITNWDDRLQPHPQEDSVGVRSFLYRLGVEAVDLGSGSRATQSRQNIAHGCKELRRAQPQGYTQQVFTSSRILDHSHTVAIRTDSVNAPPATGVTYETSVNEDHSHQITLTQEQLRSLARGDIVAVQTTSNAVPSVHAHDFVLRDQVGLWGAPAILGRDDGLWPLPPPEVNPERGRSDLEIYNMPIFMAQQQPPLVPEEGISVVLYTFVSLTPEDPTKNPPGWPRTADNQPVIILRKASVTNLYYSRAIAGFEPWRLRPSSMVELADYILLRHFRLGIPE